jgi:protocatechuate 3,4-dioxygenase beta subunit
MRNFDENTITAAVLKRFEHAKTARAHHVSEALVRHLRAFIREIEPTFEEWREAIAFLTAASGRFWFWTIIPSFYPIPNDGPVGDMLRAQGRRPFRPAHVHFMIASPGYETLVTHVFIDDDRYLDSDVVFGVKDSLIRKLERRAAGVEAAGKRVDHPFAVMTYDFVLAPRDTG